MDTTSPKKDISMADLVGEKKSRIIDDYEFFNEIGYGTYSKAFKAKHKVTKAIRCVKKIPKKDLADED